MHQEPKYPPMLDTGFVDFAGLRPNHRRDYLDGWGYATIQVPPNRPDGASAEYFNRGSIEARALTAPEA